jgi:DNA-binding Xre family transcriptional regulator
MKIQFDSVARAYQIAALKDMSISRFAEECGIHHSTLTLNKGRCGQLKLDTIFRICERFDMKLDDFFATTKYSIQ